MRNERISNNVQKRPLMFAATVEPLFHTVSSNRRSLKTSDKNVIWEMVKVGRLYQAILRGAMTLLCAETLRYSSKVPQDM